MRAPCEPDADVSGALRVEVGAVTGDRAGREEAPLGDIRCAALRLCVLWRDENRHRTGAIFRDVKVVVSLYGDGFSGELDPGFGAKIAGEGVKDKNLAILDTPSYENLCRFVMEYADGVVAASPDVDPKVLDMARASGKPMLEYQSPEAEDFFDNYNRFYEAIQ